MSVQWPPQWPAFPVMGPALGPECMAWLDLSRDSPLLAGWQPGDMADLEARINAHLRREGASAGWGGYLERRMLYAASPHFGDSATTARNLHLGLDVWAPAGTPVYAPYDGVVHSTGYLEQPQDYGAVIIITCETEEGPLYFLMGHLSRADLAVHPKGSSFRRGEIIGHLGDDTENGGWPPHLHLQVIPDPGTREGDYPGVAPEAEEDIWAARCPDPAPLVFPSSPSGSMLILDP